MRVNTRGGFNLGGQRGGRAYGVATPIIGGVAARTPQGFPSPSVGTLVPNSGGRVLPPSHVGTLGGYGPVRSGGAYGVATPILTSFGATFGPPAIPHSGNGWENFVGVKH